MRGKKFQDAIELYKLNIELHTQTAGWFDSLSEVYELVGDKQNMQLISNQFVDMLLGKPELTNQEKSIEQNAEKRLQ